MKMRYSNLLLIHHQLLTNNFNFKLIRLSEDSEWEKNFFKNKQNNELKQEVIQHLIDYQATCNDLNKSQQTNTHTRDQQWHQAGTDGKCMLAKRYHLCLSCFLNNHHVFNQFCKHGSSSCADQRRKILVYYRRHVVRSPCSPRIPSYKCKCIFNCALKSIFRCICWWLKRFSSNRSARFSPTWGGCS